MNYEILLAIAKDLGVDQYEAETDCGYTCRLLYSAIACWIKSAGMDRPMASPIDEGISRRHISDKCTLILTEFLKRWPNCKPWFDTEPESDGAVAILRSRLLRHGDLVNVGFRTNVGLAMYEEQRVSENIIAIKGCIMKPFMVYSGISGIIYTSANSDFVSLDEETTEQWITKYTQRAWWQDIQTIDKEWVYFDPYTKSNNNKDCWHTTIPRAVLDVILVRRTVNIHSYEYLLYNIRTKRLHKIDSVNQDFGEHLRFMIGLRAMSGNRVPVFITTHSDHVKLSMRVKLPITERTLLESYAWPQNNIADNLNWTMPTQIWKFIEPHFVNLGLEIMEA